MFVPFASLPSESRIWIFQGSRPLLPDELLLAETRLHDFTQAWNAHGNPLKTSFTIKFDQFIVLSADESSQGASGCSIDSSVRVLKEIEQATGIGLFDRGQVAFQINGQVKLLPLAQLKENFLKGMWNGETLTFNNLVNTKSQFEDAWLVPAGQTWLKRYIPTEVVR